MKRRLTWLILFGVLLVSVLALLWWPRIERLAIEVPPGSPVSATELAMQLQPFVGQRFLSLDLGAVRQAAVSRPWVADAVVRRIWPNRLSVRLTLQQPVARWGDKGLVNPHGKVFYPPSMEGWTQLLPLWSDHETDAAELLKAAHWLRTQTRLLGWTLVGLTRHPGGSLESRWLPARTLWMDGRDYRRQFERFLRAWPRVRETLRERAVQVDLRYSNGFTLVAGPKLDQRRQNEHHGAKKTD